MDPDRPAIRPLDVQRSDESGHRGIVLVDRLGISEPTFVPEGLLPIVARCTGEHSLDEIQRAASAQLGEEVPPEFVRGIVQQLDDRLLLVGERHAAAAGRAAATFLRGGVRPARHAGSAGYPADPHRLQAALAQMVPADASVAADLRGLVAPHIDLARGASGYAAAYRRLLAAPPADLYVLFGTGHAGPDAPVTGLPLDFATPLGVAPTDRAFVAAVHERIGEPTAADLLHHRDEHSLEFQVLWLQHLQRLRGGAPFAIAGFLCGALPSSAGDPLAEDYVQRLIAAFAAAERDSGRRVVYIAGADLAHLGPFFGDPMPVDSARLAALAQHERHRLGLLERGSPGAFHAAVDCDANPDRVCSAPAITLCAALAGGAGELLHYGQACADDGSQTVSFCAMAFAGQPR